MSGERYRGLSDVRRPQPPQYPLAPLPPGAGHPDRTGGGTGLTLPTVTTSVAGMLEEGLLVEQPARRGADGGRTFCGSTRPPGMPSGWSWGRMRRR